MTKEYYAAFIPADGSYAIVVPDLPEIASQGQYFEECVEMAYDAIKNVAKEYREHGIEMPDPSDMASTLEKLEDEMAAAMGGRLQIASRNNPVPHSMRPHIQPLSLQIAFTTGQLGRRQNNA